MVQKGMNVGSERTGSERAWIGYVAPTALFIVLTMLEGKWPAWYPWLYSLKVILVTVSLIIFRSTLRDFRFDARVLLPGILVGLLIYAIWIPLDRLIGPLHLPMGSRAAFDPFKNLHAAGARTTFLAIRFYGLVCMVPIMEELFWRSFLLRYLSNPDGDFRVLPIGQFTWGAFAIVAVAFALAHPEWLSALLCGIAYGLLLWRTRSLFAPLIAHAVTNLALGIYIVHAHAWLYW